MGSYIDYDMDSDNGLALGSGKSVDPDMDILTTN